jgi:tetratricopeptide (TPR) repeat protein
VAAHTNLGGFYSVAGRFALAIDAAEEAIALADELGLDLPARALGYRGKSRAVLGDRDGLTDMRQALALALERGESREAAVLYNNLALELWPWEGPAASLTASEEGIDFCHRRGITSMGTAIAVQNLTFLADRGRTGEVLDRAELLAEQGETMGDLAIAMEAWITSLRATTRSGSRTEQTLKRAQELSERVRPTREPQSIAPAYAAAAEAFLVHGRIDDARSLLEELVQLVGVPVDPYHVANLPALVRCALRLPEIELGDALITGAEALSPQAGYVLASCKALLLEGGGDHERAAETYLEAASGWEHHGNVPEQAYALLGQGRCLVAIADPAAEEPLRQAAELFSSMGYRPALAETEALIAQTTALAS